MSSQFKAYNFTMRLKMSLNNDNTIGSILKKNRINRYPDRGGLMKCSSDFGVHHQQWRDWESGKRTPSAENQQKLARFFGVSVKELRGEASSKIISGSPISEMAPLPIYSSAVADRHHAAKGAKVVATNATFEGYFAFREGCCGVIVSGDSMEPIARDGQMLVLAPDDRSAQNGDLVVVTLEHEAGIYFKRFHKSRIGKEFIVTLSSENPVGSIAPMVVSENDIADIRVVIGVQFEV